MTAKKATLALASAAALVLAGQPAQAQGSRHRGGGGGAYHGGGGYRGGGYGYAVPRGGAHGGGGAYARHPRAGTGYGYGHYYGGYGRGGYGGYYGRYGYYAPYYGGYYGYGYPYFGLSLSFGWPYYYGSPYYYGGYYPPAYYGYDTRPAVVVDNSVREGESARYERPERPYGTTRSRAADGDTGRLRLEVRPDDASVYVDDEFWGSARQAKYLTLRPGRHTIELVRPGYASVRREEEVVRGELADVLVELTRP